MGPFSAHEASIFLSGAAAVLIVLWVMVLCLLLPGHVGSTKSKEEKR